MKKYAIILAGGEGRRAGGNLPKQFRLLCGHPVVWWSMKAFLEEDPECELILVIHPGFASEWNIMLQSDEAHILPHLQCCGGKDRTHSVANGLKMVSDLMKTQGIAEAKVAIHDGARPLVTPSLINRGWESCSPGVCGVPAVDSTNSLRIKDPVEMPLGSKAVDRTLFAEVQTPQTFMASEICRIYSDLPEEGAFTDDASLAQSLGMQVKLFAGSVHNYKITHPLDHQVVEAILKYRGDAR